MKWKIAEKLDGARGGLLEPGAESFMINTANHNFDINTTSIFTIFEGVTFSAFFLLKESVF